MKTNNILKFSFIQKVLDRLREARQLLEAPELLDALRHASEEDAVKLRRALLRLFAMVDDSVSNPLLGSPFELTGSNPLNSMMEEIARAYGVKKSYPGTNGTTGLNVPAAMALAGEQQTLAVARDCHVSVMAAVALAGARPVYLVPPFHPGLGVLLPPTREEVGALLDRHPEAEALVLTLPTYHGLMGDIVGIVAECRGRGVLLMVDEAHGPHYRFLRRLGFPLSAEEAGADLVTQSTHKVLAALNQGSLLHFNNTDLVRRYEELQAMGFVSTSFSYPILLSIEHAVHQAVTRGEQMWREAVELAHWLRTEAGKLPGIRALDERIVDGHRVVGLDPTRVTLNVRGTGLTGNGVAALLLEQGFIIELATPDVVLFLVSPGVDAAQVEGTLRTLRNLDRRKPSGEPVFMPPPLPPQVLTPRQALMCSARARLPLGDAIGEVSAETIGCFPPGQAILVAGERVTEEVVRYLKRAVEAGGHLKRVQDDHFQTIEVLAGGGPC
ncbi:MAG TPA: hypothetical protein VGG03_01640 [Thermoanaerobaculia bacterium]|jgi:arginine/lysine/ornithine decarboxylase